MLIVLKSGNLTLLEPSGPVQATTGIALLLPLLAGTLFLIIPRPLPYTFFRINYLLITLSFDTLHVV
jgi:hypothetical protein